MAKANRLEWEKQDRGWYTSAIGWVSEEAKSKWYFYPIGNRHYRDGPFNTMAAAKECAEDCAAPLSTGREG